MAAVSMTAAPRLVCSNPQRPARPSRGPLRVNAAATGVFTPSPQQQREQGLARDDTGRGGPLRLPQLPWWRAKTAPPQLEEVQQAATSTLPILSFAGGGTYFFWELGCLRYLHRQFDLTKVQLVGASAGGLIATLAACGVDEDRAVRVAYRIAEDNGVFERPGGLAGIWGLLVREWLDELLPEDAAELCAGRVRLVVTEVPSLRIKYLEIFATRQDLIDANMASVHIPFIMDGNAATTFRGQQYIDGSLWDFVMGANSDLINCGGDACVIDYFHDDQLQWSRLDCLKLCDLQEVQAFVQKGYAYAERTDAKGDWFERTLGEVRKGAVRQLLEKPVWGMRRALASMDG